MKFVLQGDGSFRALLKPALGSYKPPGIVLAQHGSCLQAPTDGQLTNNGENASPAATFCLYKTLTYYQDSTWRIRIRVSIFTA